MKTNSSFTLPSLQAQVQYATSERWNRLSDQQQSIFKKVWSILTYKWRWQIAMNVPYLAIFILDRSVPAVHQLDMAILSSITSRLPLPETILSSIGLS